jgi:GNAT superfamily N-acetyltransferase
VDRAVVRRLVRVVDELSIRAFEPADRDAVLDLLAASLGWRSDEQHRDFFAWKHEANPFGPSLAWVADDPDAGIVGFRTLLRWRFDRPGGGTVEAVRAVDTATAPSHRGAGIFSRLTRRALDEIAGAAVGFVFNTPNDQSRPGYLKLGWEEVGRLRVQVRPRSVRSAARTVRSRVPADLWSVPTDAGVAISDALADAEAVRALLHSQPAAAGLRTARSPAFLRWRYGGFAALGYRALLGGPTAADGIVVFRLRRRGSAVECAAVEVLTPAADARPAGALVRRALRESGADHAIALEPAGRWPGFLSSERLGPILTWRGVGDEPPAPVRDAWSLTLGDVELF